MKNRVLNGTKRTLGQTRRLNGAAREKRLFGEKRLPAAKKEAAEPFPLAAGEAKNAKPEAHELLTAYDTLACDGVEARYTFRRRAKKEKDDDD